MNRVRRTTLIGAASPFRSNAAVCVCVCRWNFEAVAAEEGGGSMVGFGMRGREFRLYRLCCVVFRDRRRRSLFGGFVRFQELLGESVDLVGASDLVGQQRQFDYMEVLVQILHLSGDKSSKLFTSSHRILKKTVACLTFCAGNKFDMNNIYFKSHVYNLVIGS